MSALNNINPWPWVRETDAGYCFAQFDIAEPNSELQTFLALGGRMQDYPRKAREGVLDMLDRGLSIPRAAL